MNCKISMADDSKVGFYLLGYSYSWEPREKISDISFYSNSLLKARNQTDTSINVPDIKEDNSKVHVYLLDYSKSWEPREKLSDLSCYSKSLLKGRLKVNTSYYAKVEDVDVSLDEDHMNPNRNKIHTDRKSHNCSTCLKEFSC